MEEVGGREGVTEKKEGMRKDVVKDRVGVKEMER